MRLMDMAKEQNSGDAAARAKQPGLLIHLDELNYVNRCHDYPRTSLRRTPLRGSAGGIWARLRRAVWSVFVAPELDAYLAAEAEFQAHVVRCLNEISRAADRGAMRMDDEHRASLHTLEKRLLDALGELQAEGGRKFSQLQAAAEGQKQQLAVLDTVVRGLESIVAGLGRAARSGAPADRSPPAGAAEGPAEADYSYLLFENRYRGSEAEVAKRLEQYPEIFKEAGLPVLEIGAGRGELQELFRNGGIKSYGLELDSAMAGRCKEKGLTVLCEEGLKHLAGLADGSLGGVAAIQVVEHLSPAQLKTLCTLCLAKVCRGGKVVFETINTASVAALCRNYFRDPGHRVPLHPETMRTMMEYAGFKVLEVRKLSPYPAPAVLQKVEAGDYLTPRWVAAVELLNHNVETLNQLLYDFQDYCIIAEVLPQDADA